MAERTILPPALRPGDLVAIAAPAGAVGRANVLRGANLIAASGFSVTWRDDIFTRRGYLAGSDGRRAGELGGYLADPEVKAVLFARGGYGSSRIAGRLKLTALRRRPKIIVGYSDTTALLLQIGAATGITVFHGPFVTDGPREVRRLLKFLRGDPGLSVIKGLSFLRRGNASAPVTGGNLTMLAHAVGTPFEAKTEGKILFVEEVNEPLYKVDRLVRQLLLAGKLRRIRGLLLGSFRGCGRGAAAKIAELFLEALGDRKVPVARNFPAGHGPGNRPFPMGTMARLDSAAGTVTFAPSLSIHG